MNGNDDRDQDDDGNDGNNGFDDVDDDDRIDDDYGDVIQGDNANINHNT